MYSPRPAQPLSPPTSPRMSGHHHKTVEPLWNPQQHNQSYLPLEQRSQPPPTFSYPSYYNTRDPGQPGGHNLPTIHDGYAHARHPSSIGDGPGHATTSPDPSVSIPHRDSLVMPSTSTERSDSLEQGFGGSDEAEEDEEGSSDHEGPKDEPEAKQLTAAEIRQQKRKMKRFRLTHSQTRFLMSEFARQAHPDAAHRERLAREIPGLSPRQVQVWFQNRRAKLKRLSAEDRERMMRSRAMPDSYHMQMPVNQHYMPSPSTAGSTTPGGLHNPHMSRPGDMRPLQLDTMRRGSEQSFTSPTSVTPGLASLAFTPPQSAGDLQSPLSTTNEMTYGYGHRSMMEQRRPLMPPSHASAPSYTGTLSPGIGRMNSYERLRTSSGDPLGSPLRASMSYSDLRTASNAPQPGQDERDGQPSNAGPMATQGRPGVQREMPPPPSGVGLGFTFDGMHPYQPGSHTQQPHTPSASGPPHPPGYRSGELMPVNQPGYSPYLEYGAYEMPSLASYLPNYQQGPSVSSQGFGPSTGGSQGVPRGPPPQQQQYSQPPQQQQQQPPQHHSQPHQPPQPPPA